MASELATAYIRLMPSARGFRQAVDNEIGSDLRKAGEKAGDDTSSGFNSKFGSGIKKGAAVAATGFAAAFVGAAVIGKQSIDAASNVEEAQNKVNVVFGEGATAITNWAKTADKSLGQSRRQALDAAGGFGNLFTQLGIGGEQAATMSTQMVGLASDFASFHNADISEVLEAQSAAFRGEYDSVQKFVPTINAAAVEQRAMEMGLAATTGELDAQDKALATQALIMEGAGQATGDFARTSDGLANQQRTLAAQVENAKASIGAALIPAMTAVVSVISTNVIPTVQRLAEEWMPKLQAGFQVVSDWVRDNWPQIKQTVSEVFEGVKAVFQDVTSIITTIWDNFGEQITSIVTSKLKLAWTIIQSGLEVIRGIFQTISALIHGDWSEVWEGLKRIVDGVFTALKALIGDSLNTVKQVLSAAWEVVRSTAGAAWESIRNTVMTPVNLTKDAVIGAFQSAVDTVKTIWNGIADVASFFKREVYDRVVDVVWKVKDAVASAFQAAVDAVKLAWDKLKDVVKVPINVVIGFYNNGIRKVWNAVISKIPGVGDLAEVTGLASGGWVPGSGNRDTVPAMLTPGEFVVTKKAAQVWGPQVLAALNSGRGTIDPGVFGYATGGFVRSADEALEWARSQAGKPYRFPDVGPDTFDCSGFTSALLNYILGVNPPWRRRHSSGTVGSDPALARGVGPENGLMLGAKPPFTTNAQGASVGHVAATLMGVPMEATPPRVLVGIGARGATNGMFTGLFHLPGYGGLSDDDKAIATSVQGLQGMAVSGLTAPLGDLLQTMFNKLPGMVFDFFMKKLPGAIVDAITGAIGGLFRAVTPFANGGTAWRNGPILAGERGPELMWASRGMYMQSHEDLRARNGPGAPLLQVGAIFGDGEFRRMVREEIATLEFEMRMSGRVAT